MFQEEKQRGLGAFDCFSCQSKSHSLGLMTSRIIVWERGDIKMVPTLTSQIEGG